MRSVEDGVVQALDSAEVLYALGLESGIDEAVEALSIDLEGLAKGIELNEADRNAFLRLAFRGDSERNAFDDGAPKQRNRKAPAAGKE